MISTDKQALICDLAETYHIYDYRSIPIQLLSTLCAGLRDNSRIKLKLANTSITTETAMLFSIFDCLRVLIWMNTEDGHKGRNKPKSILEEIMKPKNKSEQIKSYATADEFEAELKRLRGGINVG